MTEPAKPKVVVCRVVYIRGAAGANHVRAEIMAGFVRLVAHVDSLSGESADYFSVPLEAAKWLEIAEILKLDQGSASGSSVAAAGSGEAVVAFRAAKTEG